MNRSLISAGINEQMSHFNLSKVLEIQKSDKGMDTKKLKEEIAHLTRFTVSSATEQWLDVSSQEQSVIRPSANNLSLQKQAAVSGDDAAALIKTAGRREHAI